MVLENSSFRLQEIVKTGMYFVCLFVYWVLNAKSWLSVLE